MRLTCPVSTRSSAAQNPRGSTLEPLESRQLFAFGQVDPGFGTAGRVITPISGQIVTPQVQELTVLPDGKILAGGSGGGLARWTSDGQIDSGFGVNGKVPAAAGATFRDHAVANDGKIYVLVSGAAGSIVIRYTQDGAIDGGFGQSGTALVSSGSGFFPAALDVQEDGRIVVAGTVRTDNGQGARARVYRLLSDGGPDMNFGSAAATDVPLGVGSFLTPVKRDTVTGVAVLSDGEIVIGGSSLAYSPEFYDDASGTYNPEVLGDSMFAVARLKDDGRLEENFGADGIARAVYSTGNRPGPATALAVKGDGSVGLAAYTDRLAYARFNEYGDVVFNRLAETGEFGRPLDIATKADGRFMVLGVPEGFSGNGLQLTYISAVGELGHVVQTGDANNATIDLYEGEPGALAVATDGNLLVGGSPGDFSSGYQVAKFDDGNPNAGRPDEFVNARANNIVRDNAGGLHLAFFDAAEHVLKYVYRAPNGLWNAPVVVDGAPESGHYLSLAVNAEARPGIAYFDGTHGDLKYAFSPAGSDWKTGVVESAGSVGLYPSLQFDTSLRATIAYYKRTGGDLKLAVLQLDGLWSYEVIDTENDVGRSTALAAQPISGRWSIAYTDTTTGTVKLAWRTKQRVWQLETAATTLGGADFLSLAYNPSTVPEGVYQKAAISFYDAYAGDLAITQFNGAAWTKKVLATQGATGLYTKLTFDAFYGPTVYSYHRTADRVTALTDSYYDGLTGQTIIDGGGRFLSIFSNGSTIDLAYYDAEDDVIKVRTVPVRVG